MSDTRRVVVRYKVKAERREEHEALVRKVFADLAERRPDGIAYQVLRLEDGLSFVHVAAISTADGRNPLAELASFAAFTAGIGDRCEDSPLSSTATAIGAYVAC